MLSIDEYIAKYLELINLFILYFYKVNPLYSDDMIVLPSKIIISWHPMELWGLAERMLRSVISFLRDREMGCKYRKTNISGDWLTDLLSGIGICGTTTFATMAILETLGWVPSFHFGLATSLRHVFIIFYPSNEEKYVIYETTESKMKESISTISPPIDPRISDEEETKKAYKLRNVSYTSLELFLVSLVDFVSRTARSEYYLTLLNITSMIDLHSHFIEEEIL